MFKCSTVFAATAAFLLLAGSAPLRANAVHVEKGASGQGLIADAFFEAPTTVNGINVTPFNDQGTIFDIFQIPSSFTSGTSFLLTFTNLSAGYGIFDCDNGSNNFAISADTPPVPLPGSACTAAPLGSTDSLVNFDEVGNTSTITFLGGSAPPQFFFWTTDGNLTGISAVATTPEPAELLLLAFGLAGLAVLRRRSVGA